MHLPCVCVCVCLSYWMCVHMPNVDCKRKLFLYKIGNVFSSSFLLSTLSFTHMYIEMIIFVQRKVAIRYDTHTHTHALAFSIDDPKHRIMSTKIDFNFLLIAFVVQCCTLFLYSISDITTKSLYAFPVKNCICIHTHLYIFLRMFLSSLSISERSKSSILNHSGPSWLSQVFFWNVQKIAQRIKFPPTTNTIWSSATTRSTPFVHRKKYFPCYNKIEEINDWLNKIINLFLITQLAFTIDFWHR